LDGKVNRTAPQWHEPVYMGRPYVEGVKTCEYIQKSPGRPRTMR
jgi:hypothetical protein